MVISRIWFTASQKAELWDSLEAGPEYFGYFPRFRASE